MTFREVQIQEVLDVQWGDTKTTKSSYVDHGYLAYSATGPDGFLPKFDYDCDGVVLSAIGANCGSTFFATNKWSCIKNTIRILTKSPDIDLKYFYFMTKSPNFWPLRGSAQPFISQTDIREMVIKIPDLAIQRKIGEIVHELELSIEQNGQITETLERIAQAIFKSWFIDFDPVKAKMAGDKPVGMDDATAALFPDSMEDSELGPLPRGWEIRSVDSFGKVVTGKTPSTKNSDYWGEEIPFVTIPDMHGQGLIVNTKRFLSKSGADSQKNQYLQKGSILVSCIATPGLVAYATELCQSNQQINSVIPNEEHPSSWLYSHLKNMIPAFINRSGIGTVFPNLNKNDFSSIQSIVSTKEIRFAYAGIVDSVYRKIEALRRESHTLESLRDSLLPRLISGELQIPQEMLVTT